MGTERYVDLKSAIEEQAQQAKDLMESWRAVQAKRIDELAKKSEEDRERIEELEARGKHPGRTMEAGGSRESREHITRFWNYIRRPNDATTKARLADIQAEIEQKAVTTLAPGADGGYAVPEEISRNIERRVDLQEVFRSLVRVDQAGTSRYHALVDLRGDEVGWAGEGDSRSETDTPTLLDVEPTGGMIYAYPKCSEEALQDIFFPVQEWLETSAADSFAAEEARVVVGGNGSKKPSGFTKQTPVTTADDASPPRDPEALQYFGVSYGSPAVLGADDLIALATSAIQERYLIGPGVAWVMHRQALAMVRQLKSPAGHYVYAEPLSMGQPGSILGYPVYTTDAMDAPGGSGFPIAFGNWRRAYLLVDRPSSLRITVDEVTTPGQVRFYIRKRLMGKVLNHQAVKLLQF